MDWPAATPYAIATLAFAQWPALWLVVVVVAAGSVHRGRAALASGVAMTAFLMVLLDAGFVGPHLDHANYGRVIFAAAVLAPVLMLPRTLWPAPGQPLGKEPPASVRRGALWLCTLPLLYGLALAIDHGFEWFDPEPTDARLSGYMVYLLLPTILAARWAARGTWLVSAPVLSRWPRLRRGAAAMAVTALLVFLHDARSLPHAMVAARDFAGAGLSASEPTESCATITAHEANQVLHLDGAICHDTPASFDAAHARHPHIRRIVLDSHGGILSAALAVGKRLEALGFAARVDGQCSSACVTIFVGAHRRYVGPEGWIAVHQVSATVWAEGNRWVRWPMPASKDATDFHHARGVSPELVTRIEGTPPESLDVLETTALVAYGIAEPTTEAPWVPLDARSIPSTPPMEATR